MHARAPITLKKWREINSGKLHSQIETLAEMNFARGIHPASSALPDFGRIIQQRLRAWMQRRRADFERRVAAYMGKAHGVMVNSGSSALMIAMRLANLPRGSEVITPALTFSSDVAAIYHADYTPVFVDVGLSDYQMRVDRIESAIGRDTRAILIPDLVGGICDWDEVRKVADRHGLFVIHDSADTLGGNAGRMAR